LLRIPLFLRYSSTILPYLKNFFSPERALEIQKAIELDVSSLKQMPIRGSKEPYLSDRPKDYRFILHKESRYFVIKIIYFIDEIRSTVFVTDFFPTSMNPDKITS
tara:strand:- start:48308 stop:48622 length:315 start_codon:yes stop_codon:yes gene_type:complete